MNKCWRVHEFNQSLSQMKIHCQPFRSFVSCNEILKVMCIMSRFVIVWIQYSIIQWIFFLSWNFGAFGVFGTAMILVSRAHVHICDDLFCEFNTQLFNLSFSRVQSLAFSEFCEAANFSYDESRVMCTCSNLWIYEFNAQPSIQSFSQVDIYTQVHVMCDVSTSVLSRFQCCSWLYRVSCLALDVRFKTLFNKPHVIWAWELEGLQDSYFQEPKTLDPDMLSWMSAIWMKHH